MKSIDELILTF